MHRRVHIGQAVFGKQYHPHAARFKKLDEVAREVIYGAQIGDDCGIDLVAADVRRRILLKSSKHGGGVPGNVFTL